MRTPTTFKIIMLLTGLVIIISATVPSQPKFKNLQILPKNISKEQLDSIMDGFKAALGVRCNFCHLRDKTTDKFDFAADEKPEKQIARKMMIMTAAINKKYFNFNNDKNDVQAVSCMTCHRTKPRPELDSMMLAKPE